MKNVVLHQDIPNDWSEREKLRDKGQFWTPDWVAMAMVNYAIEGSNLLFDPAFGEGAFYNALRIIEQSNQTTIGFFGIDIDATLVKKAISKFSDDKMFNIEKRDFIMNPPKRRFKSIVANPPYIRHHRLSDDMKEVFKQVSLKTIGETLDGRAGLHIYFLIQALRLLEDNGKLAFIMPSDTCEGVFANKLWQWISRNYSLECVVTFDPEATPFPKVDTNPIILLIRKAEPRENIIWAKVLESQTQDLSSFVKSNFTFTSPKSLRIVERRLDESLTTGLSRPPNQSAVSKYTLSQFATVMRGIATGGNDFFFMTREESRKRNIPQEFLRPAIGRTKDVDGAYINPGTLARLDLKGRPTLLFAPDGRRIEDFPLEVQSYLMEGVKAGLPQKPLISSRKPWYKMETRAIPPFLFAYLGRRNARFIRNLANILPLTGFLCVYPLSNAEDYIEKLWLILQNRETVQNLSLIGKSYGSGAIKVEPRSLERLPIPENLMNQLNLKPIKLKQEI